MPFVVKYCILKLSTSTTKEIKKVTKAFSPKYCKKFWKKHSRGFKNLNYDKTTLPDQFALLVKIVSDGGFSDYILGAYPNVRIDKIKIDLNGDKVDIEDVKEILENISPRTGAWVVIVLAQILDAVMQNTDMSRPGNVIGKFYAVRADVLWLIVAIMVAKHKSGINYNDLMSPERRGESIYIDFSNWEKAGDFPKFMKCLVKHGLLESSDSETSKECAQKNVISTFPQKSAQPIGKVLSEHGQTRIQKSELEQKFAQQVVATLPGYKLLTRIQRSRRLSTFVRALKLEPFETLLRSSPRKNTNKKGVEDPAHRGLDTLLA